MLALTTAISLLATGWSNYDFGLQPAATSHASHTAPDRARPREVRNFFPPWEGSGVYAFGPLLLDLNHGRERWIPDRTEALVDCSDDQVYCLTARRNFPLGIVAFVLPRHACSEF